MNKLTWVALAAAVAGLPACTTMHKDRRTLTSWNMGLICEKVPPCAKAKDCNADCACPACQAKADPAAKKKFNPEKSQEPIIEYITVKPIAVVMLPISWLTDTLILNPINAFKRAEVDTHDRKYCVPDQHPEWSDAHADEHAYGVVPPVTPWPVGYVLTVPEFAARWVWNSVLPTDPVNQARYDAYWHEHNEE